MSENMSERPESAETPAESAPNDAEKAAAFEVHMGVMEEGLALIGDEVRKHTGNPPTILPTLRYRFTAALVEHASAVRASERENMSTFSLKADRDALQGAATEAEQEVAQMFNRMLEEYVVLRQLVQNIADYMSYTDDPHERCSDMTTRAERAALWAAKIEERWS